MEIRKSLSAILWLTAVFQAFAGDSFCENGFTYTIMKDDNSLSLTNYQAVDGTDYSRPLHVPASVMHEGETYAVTRIESKAFKDVTEIRSVVIDEGIEYIGKYAFECCLNLKSISIPASVESIGECLFGGCHNLISVVVDAKNECYDSRDNSNAIIDSGLDELIAACSSTKIPSSVKSIGDFAFYHCYMMEELVVPEGVEIIGCDAFFGCSNLKSISLPESLTELGANAFGGCNSLTSIVIPKNVTRIGNGNIFYGCNDLTSIVVDNTNPNYDSRSHCNGIVRKLDSALIATCKTTTIGDDISILEINCFSGMAIHSVNLPKSVVTIPGTAFDDCDEIDEITVATDNPVYVSPKGANAILSKDGKTLVLGCRTTVIPDGVETIGSNAFAGRYSKLTLHIPETVKTIGFSAFCCCNSLVEVVLPKYVQRIEPFAFSNCANLSAVHIQGPLKTIDYSTFSGCYNLSAVSLPDGLENIDCYAFGYCKSLKHVSLPSSVTNICDTAFKGSPFSAKK